MGKTEGGFDEDGSFVYLLYLLFSGLEKMTEYFRRTVLRFFTDKKLLNEQFARNLLSWKHSGFSQDVRRTTSPCLCLDLPSFEGDSWIFTT